MSTRNYIRCMDAQCNGVDTRLDDYRLVHVLTKMFLREPGTRWFTYMPDRLQPVLKFLADHHSHRLTVFDEHGYEVDGAMTTSHGRRAPDPSAAIRVEVK